MRGLHAYDASNLANELYNSSRARGGRDAFADNKLITPMIANGRVFVGHAHWSHGLWPAPQPAPLS